MGCFIKISTTAEAARKDLSLAVEVYIPEFS